MLFQDTLKELRKKKNISQYDLAEALNISRIESEVYINYEI